MSRWWLYVLRMAVTDAYSLPKEAFDQCAPPWIDSFPLIAGRVSFFVLWRMDYTLCSTAALPTWSVVAT